MRSYIKTGVFFISFLVSRVVNFFNKQHDAVVLMYHSVEDSNWKYGVDPEMFARQIKYISKHCQAVPLADMVAFEKGERVSKRCIVSLTLDDGYEDTYSVVFPLLKKYQLPLTVFLTTDLSNKEVLGNLPRLTHEQIQEMNESGLVTFEVHGHSHKNFTAMSKEELREDIAMCRDTIREMTGYEPRFLAYPAGNHSKEVRKTVREMGFEAAFGITEGGIQPGLKPFILPRVQIDRTMSFVLFKLRLSNAVTIHRAVMNFLRQ